MGIKRASNDDQEKGAALVEFALLATLLFMLIFGTITTGISFSRSNALQTAAREGARFAATLPGADTDVNTWLNDVITTTQGAALGELNNGIPGRTICAAFVGGGTETSLSLNPDGSFASGTECFDDGLTGPADAPRAQVVAERETEIQAVVFAIDITVSGEAVARYER
jgi:Flp pilus assembly pilin Flp